MKYPTLTKAKTQELALALLEGSDIDVDDAVVWQGHGAELTLDDAARAATVLKIEWDAFVRSRQSKDRDMFEGQASGRLHSSLQDTPIGILDDPGFWRYLTLKYYWWLVSWRQEPAFSHKQISDFGKYIDGSTPTECVLLRMYLRGQITSEGNTYPLADKLPRSADFWRSHVVRVQTGSMPEIARALAREQAERKMSTEPLRSLARSLNRLSTNVVLYGYDREEAEDLIKDLRAEST